MTKPQLRLLAIVLSGLILVVLFAGLDDLPRSVRAEITAEQRNLAATQKQFASARDEVTGDLRAEPDLFRAHAMATAFPQRLARAEDDLRAAKRDSDALARLNQANRRVDREQAEQLLHHERSLRSAALGEVQDIQREARHWLDVKRHLPDEIAQMERDYTALHAADLEKVTALVTRAENDWPEKKADLEARLAALRAQPAEAGKIWQSSAEARRKIAANDLSGLDYAALIAAADALHAASADLAPKITELGSLSGQLYDSWDKILVDLEIGRAGERRDYNEKIRTVRTHLVDVAARKSETSSDDKWVEVSRAEYLAEENHLGMAIGHKSAGKFDAEAERVAQPAGFAYMAAPAQGSNQYGYWEHRDGSSFWVWFPQYLILRDLLWHRDYRPLGTGEYEAYRTAQRGGQTYYGRDESGGSAAPKYGSQGTFTQQRYADSNYARSGGYRDSRYATGGGSYRGSRYQSPGAQSGQDSSPRRFGRQADSESDSRRSWSKPDNSHDHSARPGPRPSSPRSFPSPGAGRRFGGRRR